MTFYWNIDYLRFFSLSKLELQLKDQNVLLFCFNSL